MANNTQLSAGTLDGAVIATDDIGGVHYQYVKTGIGTDDTFTILVGGSGNVAAGVQRVVLATDQPALTNKLLVTPDLPSGASTLAEQQTQTTSLQLIDDVVYAEDLAANSGDKGVFVLGVAQGSNASATAANGDYIGLGTDSNGRLRIVGPVDHDGSVAGSPLLNGGYASAAAPTDVSGDGDIVRAWYLRSGAQVVNLSAAGTLIPSGSGTSTGALRVELPTNGTGIVGLAAGTNGIGKLTANSGVTIGAVEIAAAQTLATVTTVSTVTSLTQMNGQAIAMGTGTRSAGTQRVTIATDDVVPASQSGTWTVQPGNTANTTPWLFVPGGSSGYNNTDVQETASQIKGSAGVLMSGYVWNMTNAPLWLKIYDNVSASVTPGTTAPTYDLMVPANNDTDGAGFVMPLPAGLTFSTGITISGSTTRGTTAADVGSAGNMGIFATYR